MRKCGLLVLGLLVVAGLPGCQKALKDEKKITLGPGEVQSYEWDAPRYAQKIKVEVSSSKGPIGAYVVLSENAQQAVKDLQVSKAPANPLAGKDKADKFDLEASIPAGKSFTVVLGGSTKDTEVTVKITSR